MSRDLTLTTAAPLRTVTLSGPYATGGAGGDGAAIDDSTTSAFAVWSSQKTDREIDGAVEVGNLTQTFNNGLV